MLAAMASGFLAMSAYAVFGGMIDIFGAPLSAPAASLAGALLALIAGIAVSYFGSAPSRAEAEYLQAMRNPEGDTSCETDSRPLSYSCMGTAMPSINGCVMQFAGQQVTRYCCPN